MDSLVIAEELVPKLESENKYLSSSTTRLTAQLEETERRFEEERKLRKEVENTRESRIKEVEDSWNAVLAEKQDNWDAREKAFGERADNQDRLLRELKASYEVSQRLEHGNDDTAGTVGGASTAELEIISSELERANLRLADVQARNEQLRLDLAQAATHKVAETKPGLLEDEPAFMRLRSENSSLLRKVDAARVERESDKRSWEISNRGFKKEIVALREDSEALRKKVKQWADYDDVKRELEVLKSIEFATGENDDGDDDTQAARAALRDQSSNQNLEQLLLARNKKLNHELTVLRVSHQDLASRLELLQADLSNTNMELERSRNLTATLENDLSRVQQEAANAFPSGAASVAGTYASRYPTSSYQGRRGGRASPTSSIISGFEAPPTPTNLMEAIRNGEPVGGGSGMMPMIIAQRDRFKKRNAEMEAELTRTHQTVSSLRAEVASLQKDNLNLYEKTRYVSTYSRGQPATSSSAYNSAPSHASITIGDEEEASIDRYKSAYESKLSPFAAFRGRESARVFKKMGFAERSIYRAAQTVLATRTSRNSFAVYFVALHGLILFFLLYSGDAQPQVATVLNSASSALADRASGLSEAVPEGVSKAT